MTETREENLERSKGDEHTKALISDKLEFKKKKSAPLSKFIFTKKYKKI
jgi:hypothetical protein